MSEPETHLPQMLVESLTRREREILGLLNQGYSAPEIAEQLTLAVSSIKWHTQHLYGKLGVHGKRQAILRAREIGLLDSIAPALIPPSQFSPTGHTFGSYHLLEKLGAGGMAEVYKAYQSRLERYVALKFMRRDLLAEPGFSARFEREARLLARFSHPNIVHIYDFGQQAEQCYLAMEFVAGQTLAEWLKVQGRALPMEDALLVLRQVSAALDAAHAQNIVHLDVKPSNVMLTADGRALLSDFGLSRLVQTDPSDTDSIVTSGSPNYMSPEQISRDLARIGTASDVYALGIVAYEMLTGRVPFLGDHGHPVFLQHLHDPVPSARTFNPDLPEAAEAVLFKALAKDSAERYQRAGEFVSTLAEGVRIVSATVTAPSAWPAITIDEAPAPGEPPFKGLRYFDEVDAELFFGREALTDRLIQRLKDERFLAVVGASGSGKSSLVRAGVLPALRRSDQLPTLLHVITPGTHPLEALAVTLTRGAEHVTDTANLLDDLTQEPRTLYLWARRQLAERQLAGQPPTDGQTLLLVVDQFEEVFTLCHDEAERQAFVDNLMMAVGPPAQDQSASADAETAIASVVLTLRADFYAHCGRYPELRDWLAARQEYIGPMTFDELRDAIEEPALLGGWTFEPGLVDLLLKDVGASGERPAEPGALPLLSHALLETWQRRRGRTLTFGGYIAAGGVHGAIAHTADAVYGQLDPKRQAIARNIFLRLTELGEGTGDGGLPSPDTRRRVSLGELIADNASQPLVELVLKTLADARLITTSAGAVEVAHEALIREWPALRDWLNEDRESLRLHRHLTEAALAWDRLKRDSGELYRGARLTQAVEWAEGSAHHEQLSLLEHDFLRTSQALTEREESEREAQRQRELRLAEAKAETERQRAEDQAHATIRLRTRNRVITTVGAVAVLLAILAGLFGWQSNQNAARANENLSTAQIANLQEAAQRATAEAASVQADEQRNAAINAQATAQANEQSRATQQAVAEENFAQAEAQRLAAESNSLAQLDGDAQLSALLVIRSLNIQHTLESDKPLLEAADGLATIRQQFIGHTDVINPVSFSPDGRYILTGSADGTARLWDAQTGEELRRFVSEAGDIPGVAFSPDGKNILTAGGNGTAQLWDAQTGQKLRSFSHGESVTSVAFSPDGQYMLTGSWDKTAQLWDVRTGQTLRSFTHDDAVASVAFSPDGQYILTASGDKTARLWDARSGQELWRFTGHSGIVIKAVFSPDGKYVLTGSWDSTARLLDARTGDELRIFAGHIGGLNNVAFSPDGQYILTASWDKTARLWDARTGQRLSTLTGNTAPVNAVAFSPDSQFVLTGGANDNLWLWDVVPELPRFVGHTNSLNGIAFSPDGQYLLTGSWDGTARLWDSRTGQEKQVFTFDAGVNHGVAFSPDGSHLLIGSWDTTVVLYDIETGEQERAFDGAASAVQGVAFSPDGKYVVTASDDKTVRLWDFQTRQQVLIFEGHSAVVSGVAFSPDSKYLLTGSDDMTARLWDVGTGEEIRRFTGHTAPLTGVAFSPDGKQIATSSLDNTARIWDVETGEELQRFSGHSSWVWSVAFSPDGKYLLTSSHDATARLWDVGTGEEVRRFASHTAAVKWAVFSPDGKLIATASDDGTAQLADVDYHTTIEYVCSRLTRDFTDKERAQYNIPNDGPTCPVP